MTTDSFLVLCKQTGLSFDEIDQMTIGGCLDYIDAYIEYQNPKKKRPRRASQSDFDKF